MFWQKPFNDFVARMTRYNLPLRLQLWNGSQVDLGPAPRVQFRFKSPSALRHLLRPSMASLGQAYVEEQVDVEGAIDDVVDLAVQLSAHGSHHPTVRRGPRLLRHTRRIDAEAISYHYDVSNDFYRLWLDKEMVYSCAYFRSVDDSLEQAQIQKLDHILTKLDLRPGQRLLDIGCGWGALALRAAKQYDAQVVGITLSQHQFELARQRVAEAGLQGRVDIRIQDYRDVAGKFDRIVSVGMFEHVGLRNLRGYFAKIHDLLEDDGICLNHGITSTDDESAEVPLGGGDFIERYVFPHGELPHIAFALKEMAAAGLEMTDVENLRRHYALTTRHWSQRFERHGEPLRAMVGEKRYRIWRAYLAGCSYGFARNWIAIHQILSVKANVGSRGHPLPLTREYMYAAGRRPVAIELEPVPV